MNIDAHTIDRIVAGVLHQLAAGGDSAPTPVRREATPTAAISREATPTPAISREATPTAAVSREATPTAADGATSIAANLITAEVLLDGLNGRSRAVVSPRAIVTPAAWDAARERGVEIVRVDTVQAGAGLAAHSGSAAKPVSDASASLPLLIIVRSTDSVMKLYEDLQATWRRELLGCPDDAAELAISAICRGETTTVVILATQPHRAACLANRNEKVRAAAIHDAGDVRAIRKQLRANIWCLDPNERSWFELRTVLRAITDN